MLFESWLYGLLASIIGGHFVVCGLGFLLKVGIERAQRKQDWGIPKEAERALQNVPYFSALTGVIERGFFTILVGLGVPGAPAIAGPFFIVKMATGWHRIGSTEPYIRMYGFRSLMLNIVSIGIGIISGWIIAKNTLCQCPQVG